MSLLAAPPLLQDGRSAVIFTVAFIVIVALLLAFWRFKGR
ncbi:MULTISPECIES: cell wall-associated protein [Streptomyces]|nr:cell wall-associated protein [Streptomyces sp. KA12]MBD2835212.1 cell wall-associated protein [Streptomyces pratensis]MDF0376502.1 cell wall-associated protein [Streptomyces sp. KA12]